MKKFIELILGCMVLAINAEERFATVTLKNGNTASLAIIIAQEDAQAMEDAGAVFVKSFADYYSQFSLEQLYLKDEPDIRTTFLKAAFEDEKKDFFEKKPNTIFVVARDLSSNNVIGFVGFDKSTNNGQDVLYIRQLAVDRIFEKQGLGKALVLETAAHLISAYPARLTVGTRHVNTNAIAFYNHLGFVPTPIAEVHHELPAYKYQGFYKIVESR